MSNVRPPSLFARWTRGRRTTLRSPEPADLGTAYGMECWLDQMPPPSVKSAASSTRAAPSGWIHRLLAGKFSG